MKQFLLSLALVLMTQCMWAQLTSGAKMPVNIVTKDIKGNDVDIWADLDAGKSVVLDFFATWCGPCWNFHNSGLMKNLHNEFGPNGTDQIRLYAIEADGSTTNDDLIGRGSRTIGDWTAGVPYTIIDNHTFNSAMRIDAFPTIYIIRPDRSVFEVGNFRNNRSMWERALMPTAEVDLILTTGIDDRTFCTSANFNQRPGFMNIGSMPISNFDVVAEFNDSIISNKVTTPVNVFSTGRLSVPAQTLRQSTNISFKLNALNGEEVDIPVASAQWYKPTASSNFITVKFTTDSYPGDIDWVIRDDKNNDLFYATYEEGNQNSSGLGGPDANKTFEYKIDIADLDISCMRMTVNSRVGRGLSRFNPAAHPVPGVEIYDANGNLIKPKLRNEINFFANNAGSPSSVNIFIAYDKTSSIAETQNVEIFRVMPNPASQYIELELDVENPLEVSIIDNLGRIIKNVQQTSNIIDINELPVGTYHIKVLSGESVYQSRFIKQ